MELTPVERHRRTVRISAAAGVVIIAVTILVGSGALSGSSQAEDPPSPSRSAAASSGPQTSTATPEPTPAPTEGSTPSTPGPTDAAPPSPPAPVLVPPIGDVPPTSVQASEPAALGGGLTVSVVSVEAVTVAGTGAGEYAGPGVAVTVRVVSSSSTDAALTAPSVAVYAGESGEPLYPVLSDPATSPLPAVVPAGQTVDATYRFTEPSSAGAPIAVVVLLSPDVSPVVAQGFRLG